MNMCTTMMFFKYLKRILLLTCRSSEIEERVRKAIKGVLSCDILSEDVIDKQYGQFDAITSSACLESSSIDLPTYRQNVKRLASLLKDGGYVAIFGFMEFERYQVGEKFFSGLALKRPQIEEAFKDAGFVEVTFRPMTFCQEMRDHYGGEESAGGVFTLSARKAVTVCDV